MHMIKKIFSYIWNNRIIRHLFYMLAALVGIIVAVNIFLMQYTHHGEGVRVPEIKGLKVSEISHILQKQGLHYQVIDSHYISSARPGIILEQIPRGGTSVKHSRTVYLVINSMEPQKMAIPELSDISVRQAQSLLVAYGFPTPQIEYVASPYKDLVVGVRVGDRQVAAGEKLPVTTLITLQVGAGDGQ